MAMAVFFLVLAIFLASMAGLAAGIMSGRAPIKGSCGGLACGCSGQCRAENRPEGESGK
jgi:hypothetical protein